MAVSKQEVDVDLGQQLYKFGFRSLSACWVKKFTVAQILVSTTEIKMAVSKQEVGDDLGL